MIFRFEDLPIYRIEDAGTEFEANIMATGSAEIGPDYQDAENYIVEVIYIEGYARKIGRGASWGKAHERKLDREHPLWPLIEHELRERCDDEIWRQMLDEGLIIDTPSIAASESLSPRSQGVAAVGR